ncbi:MAG: hypothetical protein KC964_12405, partial [Candidatus Omnitrophica bacterium]|nr:hypothetical protein [Candidatus Omnitrophota bacterium]
MKNICSTHLRKSLLCLVLAIAGLPIAHSQEPSRPFFERFRDPPPEARILKIVHRLPEAAEGQEELLDTLTDQGFGGMATNVAFDDYLESEENWAACVQGVNMAKARGMALWLYDERGYPSCKAGGLTLRDHPEWQAQGLYIADTISRSGEVKLEAPPGEFVLASAFPVKEDSIDLERAVDLSDSVSEGNLTWNAPEGEWRVMIVTKDFLHKGTHADG